MRDIYVCVIFLRVKIYWIFFYWSHFFDVHFSYCEVFMCQVLGGLNLSFWDEIFELNFYRRLKACEIFMCV